MKQTCCFLFMAFFAGVMLTHAQTTANVHGNLHIHAGANLTFFGDVQVPAGGLLHNEAGTLYTRANVTGEERIQLDAGASLHVDGGTFTFANETDEAFLNLEIGSSGSVVVPPTRSLTITGTLNNTSTDTGMYLLADATGYAQLLTTGTVTNKGILKAEQYITAATNAGWRQLASPVSATLAQLDDDFETTYPTAPGTVGDSLQWNVWWYDASPLTPGQGNNMSASNRSAASATYWTPATNNTVAFGPANNAKTFNVSMGGSFAIYNGGILDVAGALGNGTYTFDCYQTHDMGPRYNGSGSTNPVLITGWNLIPNPYPSNISVSALLADNSNFGIPYKAVHVWDAKTQQYTAITNDIINAIDWNTGSATSNLIITEAHNIAPFQAFWVKAYNGNRGSSNANADHNITLTNAHRTVQANVNFFKSTPPVIALRTWDASGLTKDQTLLTFGIENANQLDDNDALKLRSGNNNVPSLATVIEGVPLSVNRLAWPAPSHSIPVHFESAFHGAVYNLAMATADIDPTWTVYLEDRKEEKMINLRGNATYTFLHDTRYVGNRFMVHINKVAGNINPDNWDHVVIYGNDEGINVAFANPQSTTAEVLISTVAGQLVFSGTVTTGTRFVYPVRDDVAMYVVRVLSGTKVVSDKIVR